MTPEEYREHKEEIQKSGRKMDPFFTTFEYAYNEVYGRYGEVSYQCPNSKYFYVDGDMSVYWYYKDCIFFDNEKEMLVHKIKND